MLTDQHFGQLLALITAIVWAVSVILFKKSGESVHPFGLNLFKDLLAAVLFIPTTFLAGQTLFYGAPFDHYLLLLASGILGIGISDSLFFMSLNRLGAGLSAIVDCLYSPFIIILSILWLGEQLTVWQVVGVVLIVSAVLTATSKGAAAPISRKNILIGVLLGAGAMATMAVSIVMVKPLLEQSPLLWVTEIRLIGGIAALALIIRFNPNRRNIMKSIVTRSRLWYTVWGSFFGGFVAMGLWLGGMKYAQASIAAALNQTSNIFIFIFAALLLHEPLTYRRIIGIGLGFVGSLLVTII
jgi:drug/metabolite transporter (DMT)-like permease